MADIFAIIEKISRVFDFAVKNEDNIKKAYTYFKRFGYLKDNLNEITVDDISAAIHLLQTIGGLKKTGIIDPNTLKLMEMPRCCLQDNVIENATNLQKWSRNDLSYYIKSYDMKVGQKEWYDTIESALGSISDVCGLKFNRVSDENNANLIMDTGRGQADDFDGSSGVLAWFQLPTTANYVGQCMGKFDLDESWLSLGKTGRGILLKNVACHEICHGLGLSHSNVSEALMAPFYSPAVATPQKNDDIPRLVARYGKPQATPTIPQTPTIPPNIPQTPTQGSDSLTITITGQIKDISIPGYRVQKLS